MARCAAAPWPARWAMRGRGFSAAATKPSFSPSMDITRPPRAWMRACAVDPFRSGSRAPGSQSRPWIETAQKGSKMAKVVVVTSGKGGVGKTTSTAALGAALAQSGQSVVVVDFDVGLRNLDLVMGAERRVVFDLINVVQGVAKLSQALIRDKRIETLWLLPASQTRDKDALTDDGVRSIIADLRTKFDWILCDSPAGIERGATLAMRYADDAVIVTNPEVASLHNSDRIIAIPAYKTAKSESCEQIEKHILIT